LTLLNSPYERDGIPLDQLGLLHQCCRYGLADIAAKIIKAGSCTVNYRRSKNGQTPLHYLARYCSTLTQDEQSEMFFVLSSARIDLNVLDFSGCAPLHYLLDQTYTGPLVQVRIAACFTSLCHGVSVQLANATQLFIGAGSDLFIPRASDGLRPIHLMANHNHHVSLQANMTRLKPEINARQDRPPHRVRVL
jgi:ankyrin repeat protein